MEKSPEAFRTISEVAEELDLPQHVLRFWESKFSQVRPMKRGGGRRYYRPQDVDLLRGIRSLLYGEGYTIRGVQKLLRENGVSHVIGNGKNGAGVEAPKEDCASENAVKAAQQASGLSREQVQVLQATLYELSEVKRLIDESSSG